VHDVVAEIDWAKARLVGPDEYAAAAAAAARHLPRPAAEIADVYARYEADKRTRRVLDFDDVLGRCAEAIERDDEFAATQRFRFRHLFVDEFQDATPRQLRLLRAWLGDRDDLAVVGDPAQAIYGFAGADASPLCDFGLVFPGGATVSLVRNYRSSEAVVGLAEAALGTASGVARAQPEAVRGGGAAPTFVAYDDDEAEAEAIAEGCRRTFRSGVPWHEIAVLFRTNAQCAPFEAALGRRLVPCRVAEGGRFATRPGGRALVDRLRKAERAAPERPLSDHLADLAADDGLTGDDVLADRETLLDLGREFLAAQGGTGDVAGLVAWVDSALRPEWARGATVDLATFHRAKGLEWSVVFVTGLERGLVPIGWATDPVSIAEERRLLHVAFSRAADDLHCSWARTRTVGTRRAAREPSPWLGALEHTARDLAVAPPSLSLRMAEMRDALGAASAPTPRRRAR
jgi:DNA helicase-2/ATP-dependent DNA helicase PcrA